MSSCSSGLCGTLTKDVVAGLKKLSSAEDFFRALGVAFDPAVLNVARLHILKRMGAYLATDDLDGLPDSVAAARAKAYLERAYEDFVASSPIEQRVFKVHKDAVAPSGNFVSFDTLLN
jgi:nitrogenase-stabilizing/protective protein